MPYSNFGEFQTAAENSALNRKSRNALSKYLYDTQLKQNIQDRSFSESRDPRVFAPESHNKVVPLPTRGGPAKYASRSQEDPMISDWNTIKDTIKFVKDNPKVAMESAYLGTIQSPIKLIGRLGEATWAKGNDEYQNTLSDKALNKVLGQDAAAFRSENAPTNGSYNDVMKRIKEFQGRQDMIESMRPEFTSDTTLGDVADVASWAIPGPEGIAKGVIKTGEAAKAVGEISKNVGKFALKHPRTVAAGSAAAGAGLYSQTNTDNANAASFESIMNLGKEAKVSGRMRTELDRIVKQINKTTSKRYGSGKGLGKADVEEFIKSYLYNPMNRGYIDRVASGEALPGGEHSFLVGAHETGKTPALGGGRNPNAMQSGELNRLEMDMRRAGGNPQSSLDVLYWAMENNPKYAGHNISDMIIKVGT